MHSASIVSRGFGMGVLVIACTACGGAKGSIASPASPTPLPAPSQSTATFMLFGVVTEVTPSGLVPIEGARVDVVSCAASNQSGCSNSSRAVTTDAQGLYFIQDVYSGAQNTVWVSKAGFEFPSGAKVDGEGAQTVRVTGDTRLDIQLVRR
jgi:hypothetical protein